MKIIQIEDKPLCTFPCVNVAPGGKRVETRDIPVLRATVEGLSEDLDAIVVTSDLQAYDRRDIPPRDRQLLGYQIAERLPELFSDPGRVGVILAGDFYAIPELNKRGGLGDVDPIWRAFAKRFRWVVGVAGNHDSFAGRCDFHGVFSGDRTIYPLHGTAVHLDGLWMGGVSGIRGPFVRPWRHTESTFKKMLRSVLGASPDILILHEGPDRPDRVGAGRAGIRKALNKARAKALVICGHRHWPDPSTTLPNGTQVLNVDSRVVLLTRPGVSLGAA